MSSTLSRIQRRKRSHLEVCVDGPEKNISGTIPTGFELVRLQHEALPELHIDEIDTHISFLGKRLNLPLMISCMTGGTRDGRDANRDLAIAAQECGVAVGLGSLRVGLEHPEVLEHFAVKEVAPDVPVIANIAATQLREIEHQRVVAVLQHLQVQGIAVHLNPGQELFQENGDRNFRGLETAITKFTEHCPLPVIVKETGFGISVTTALRLVNAGVDYIDIAGSGGTNWVLVEAQRLDKTAAEAATELADWGNPTASVLADMRDEPRLDGVIIASGGLRSGKDIAKSIALGAELGAIALPFIKDVFAGGPERVKRRIALLNQGLRAVMLLTGSRTIEDLKKTPISVDPTLSFKTNSR